MRLLIAYDGSPNAATAVRAAAGLFPDARAYIATVPSDPTMHAVHSVAAFPSLSPDVLEQAIDDLTTEARREAGATEEQGVEQMRTLGLDAEPAVVRPSDPAWAALIDAAHGLGADVIVCGTRGRGAFARAVLGSTSSSLLHHTDMPLLVVPDGSGALDGPVVVAYDGSEGAKRAVQAAGRLLPGHPAVVVHAWEPMFRRILASRALAAGAVDDLRETVALLHDELADREAAITEEGVAAARAAGLDAVGDTVESDDGAWRAVAAAARAHGASVIVIGTRGLGSVRSALLGSVSSGLVQNAELPVLVVPGER